MSLNGWVLPVKLWNNTIPHSTAKERWKCAGQVYLKVEGLWSACARDLIGLTAGLNIGPCAMQDRNGNCSREWWKAGKIGL